MPSSNLLTTAQAAQRLGLKDSSRIRRYIESGRLPATLYGKTWLIREDDLTLIEHRPAGWPKGRPRSGRKTTP